MRALHVRPEAELDMFEAALWYDGERSGLGSEFLKAVRYVLGRIEEGALQFPLVTTDIRRAILRRFPFGIFFVVEGSGHCSLGNASPPSSSFMAGEALITGVSPTAPRFA